MQQVFVERDREYQRDVGGDQAAGPLECVHMTSALEPIGMTYHMPLHDVLRMVLLGNDERIGAGTALRIGLLSEITTLDELWPRAHELATARARRDTVVRRLAELDRLQESLRAETAREEALREDAAKAIEALAAERQSIEGRLADGESQAARVAADLTAAEASSRQAEADLAALLAREAAMRAERRVSEAALEAARTQADRAVADAARLAPHLVMPGNRPSSVITMDSLTPATLGAMLALYEHRTYCSGLLWRINSFDQWGVELGKEISTDILGRLSGEGNSSMDAATERLIDIWKSAQHTAP